MKHYSEDLGFKYLSATNKEEYLACLPEFLEETIIGPSIIMELFVSNEQEDAALAIILNTIKDVRQSLKTKLKTGIKQTFGDEMVDKIRSIVKA